MAKKSQDESVAESMEKLRAKGWDGEVLARMAPSGRKFVHGCERLVAEKRKTSEKEI